MATTLNCPKGKNARPGLADVDTPPQFVPELVHADMLVPDWRVVTSNRLGAKSRPQGGRRPESDMVRQMLAVAPGARWKTVFESKEVFRNGLASDGHCLSGGKCSPKNPYGERNAAPRTIVTTVRAISEAADAICFREYFLIVGFKRCRVAIHSTFQR